MIKTRKQAVWLWLAICVIFMPPGGRLNWPNQQSACTQPDQSVSLPLTELGSSYYVRFDGQETSFTGGLYPNGQNVRPPAHEAAGLVLAEQVVPLDSQGNPDLQNGKIGFISVGMSNANMEFSAFIKMAREDASINPQVVLVNGALPNRTAERWADPNDETWREAVRRVGRNDLTPEQIQIAWVKQVRRGAGPFPDKTLILQQDLEAIARNLHARFPNLKIAFFSSRTRSYDFERGLSPEPLAFESGFAVKWMIEKQIEGDPSLNYDPDRGEVVAPYLSWGPYLWINGMTPRQDGQVWEAADLRRDCTHPSASGADKVAGMLMDFFKTDTLTRGWFLAGAGQIEPPATSTRAPLETVAAPTRGTSTPAGGAVVLPSDTPESTRTSPPSPVAPHATDTVRETPITSAPVAAPLPPALVFFVLGLILVGLLLLILLRKRK